MFYKYNSITGRLIRTTQLAANYPQGFQTLRPAEPINPYLPKKAVVQGVVTGQQPVKASSTATSSSSPRLTPSGVPYSPLSPKLKMLQEKFQVDDGVPVHLKGGPLDKVLYYTTLGLCAVGLVMTFRNLYLLANPKSASDSE